MNQNSQFRIKSPQLYQLSYRPKHTEPLALAASDDSGEWSTVPAVCPGLHRRQRSIPSRLGATLYFPRLA